MSKVRLLKAFAYYPDYLTSFFSRLEKVRELSYDKLYATLANDGFAMSDCWKKYLESTNNFNVFEIITNSDLLQKTWAKENKISYSKNSWALEILEAQIMQFNPDVFFAHDYNIISPSFLIHIKKKCPGIKLVFGWDGINYRDENKFHGFDLVLSCIAETAAFYSENTSIKGYYFPLGFDSRVLERIANNLPKYDISFVGSVFLFDKGHNDRLRYLSALARKYKLSIWISNFGHKIPYFSREQVLRLLNLKFIEYISINSLHKINQGGIFGNAMYQVLADSKITFNCHIDAAGESAANIRLFEATGVGSCLLTDWKKNLSDFFIQDKEVCTYRTVDDCFEKIDFLLHNETIRKQIAFEGKNKTLNNHTMEQRINVFSHYLLNTI